MDPRTVIAEIVAAYLPSYRIDEIGVLGSGLENTAFCVRGERDLVVRFPHQPDPAAIANEVRLLAKVTEVSPLPVPDVAFHDDRCLAYWFLAGRPLEPEDGVDAEEIGDLLRRLHAMPLESMRALVKIDNDPLSQWRDEAAEIYERHREAMPPARRRKIESFLAEELPEETDRVVFSHNDLGVEHVLVDGGEITGIIDWSDAAICDPAYDYGLLLRDLADKAPAPPDGLAGRALFYAKCSAIEDFSYGLERGVRWLF